MTGHRTILTLTFFILGGCFFTCLGKLLNLTLFLSFHLDLLCLHFGSGLEDGSSLHLGDLRVNNTQTATTVTKHGVFLMQSVDTALDLGRADFDLLGKCADLLVVQCADELVQWWVKQANRRRTALKGFENADKVLLLVWQGKR